LLQTNISPSKVALSAPVLPDDVSLSKWRMGFAAKAASSSCVRRRRMKSVATSPSILREHGLEQMVASGGKPSRQADFTLNRFAFRLVSFFLSFLHCCREEVLEAIVINPRKMLAQHRGSKFIRP
jgi:hypothetical protein